MEEIDSSALVLVDTSDADEKKDQQHRQHLTINTPDNDCRLWVIVFGSVGRTALRDEILVRLETFGRIQTARGGTSNWLAVQYSSEHEAEEAIRQSPFQVDTELIGVTKISERLHGSLDFSSAPYIAPVMGSENSHPTIGSDNSVGMTAGEINGKNHFGGIMRHRYGGTNGASTFDSHQYNDTLYLRGKGDPKRNQTRSCCEQVLGALFGWELDPSIE